MDPFPEEAHAAAEAGTAVPVASTLIDVTTQRWSLLGRSFGPEQPTALRLTLMSDGSCTVIRTDGKPLGDLAVLYSARIASARTDLQLRQLHDRSAETKRTTRRVGAARDAHVQLAGSGQSDPTDQSALERKRKSAELSSTRFLRYDPKTVTDRIGLMRDAQGNGDKKGTELTAQEELKKRQQQDAGAWDEHGADK